MRDFHNIDKSGFHKGQYVGYAAGKVWRIRRANSSYGNWVAFPQNTTELNPPYIYAFRLSEMSEKLNDLTQETNGFHI